MTIIEQLEQSVSLPILGNEPSIAHISLLEQYYALLIARLASAKVYTQLLQANHQLDSIPLTEQLAPQIRAAVGSSQNNPANSPMFMQLWPDKSQRNIIIDELVVTHHIDNDTTIELVTSATTLAYRELKDLAKGQFLPAFLQQQQAEVRHYLPVWAESVLTDDLVNNAKSDTVNNLDRPIDTTSITDSITNTTIVSGADVNKIELDDKSNHKLTINKTTIQKANAEDDNLVLDTDNEDLSALHIPIDDSGHSLNQINSTRQRNKRNDLLLCLFLLLAAIAVLALLWLFIIKPNYIDTAEPVVVAKPVVVIADKEPVATVLKPVELLVAVDNGGSLYTCSATVGDSTLQQGLNQALIMSFDEQASICQLTIEEGVATDLTKLDIGLLPSFFTLLRSVPFARLQLQNNVITIESPNDEYSQRLLTDMRALAPTAIITTTTPLSAAENNTVIAEQQISVPNNSFDEQNSEGLNNDSNYRPTNNGSLNNNNTNGYNGDNVNNNNNANNNNNGTNSNLNNNAVNNRPIGGMSDTEVDDLANTIIVNEQLRNESRVQPNVAAEQ